MEAAGQNLAIEVQPDPEQNLAAVGQTPETIPEKLLSIPNG